MSYVGSPVTFSVGTFVGTQSVHLCVPGQGPGTSPLLLFTANCSLFFRFFGNHFM